MLEQFVHAFPGSLAPILLTMVYGAVCRPMDVQYHSRSRFLRVSGVIVGLVMAVIFAGLRATGVLTQRTVVNYPTLISCVILDAAAIATCIYVALRPNLSRRSAQSVNAIFALSLAVTYFRAFPDVILNVTNFVETGESIFTSDMLLRAVGFALGIAASVVIAAIFSSMKSSVSVRIFSITAVGLIVCIAAQHCIDLLQILFSTRTIRLNKTLFTALAWGLNHSLSIVIAQTVVFALPIMASLIAGWRRAQTGETIAIVRQHRKFKRHAYAAVAFSVLAVCAVSAILTYGVAATHQEIKLAEPEKYAIDNGIARIDVSQVNDGHLHRFKYQAHDGTIMYFLAIKKGAGSVVVVLDACDSCGDAGYYEKDGKIICKECDVAMNIATIGFKGGCNPVPLNFDNDGTTVTVKTTDLDAMSSYFKR
ncbi:Fe-S-containing protein [Alloscardovia omnicolens]|uniref:Fe-S-containing protein n=1 Tax=Alloscardovia omnicolens TaxID=419015 RepID=UPI003A68A49A